MVDADELRGVVADPGRWPASASVLLVDLDTGGSRASDPPLPFGFSGIVIGSSTDAGRRDPACDLVIGPHETGVLDAVAATVSANPIAATTLVTLLRTGADRSVETGLLAESACYSALQAGEEFRRWRAATPVRPIPPVDQPVLVRREGPLLRLTLNRPDRRNALDTSMRDALAEALTLGTLDDGIERILLDGAGPAFCSGGDLDQFGTAPDPATAHLVRIERSLGALLAGASGRLTARIHGACVGSGIEMAAFAGEVIAAPDVQIGLPEVSMGLIPGAGGTVSITRRIGRHRTCRLGLSGERLDAATALDWGLVDRIR